MNEKLTQLISELESQLDLLNGDIDEYNEIWGEDGYVDAMDASGGNFDDAYTLGSEHGEMFAEAAMLSGIIRKLKAVTE